MKRLSDTQSAVLVTLLDGDIINVLEDDTISLEDADKNTYSIRKTTFKKLLNDNYIECSSMPSIDIYRYRLSQKGIDYLETYHKKVLDNFKPLLRNDNFSGHDDADRPFGVHP